MVVKIGSSTVVGADGKVNRAFIGGLADQAAALRKPVSYTHLTLPTN